MQLGRLMVAFAIVLAACGSDRVGGRNESAVTGAALDAVIAERVSVEEDATLFTLFAMLNAAGYDEENFAEMHPVRRSVRGALPRLLPDAVFAKLESFHKNVGGRASLIGYAIAAKATSGPPDFVPRDDWAERVGAASGRFSNERLAAALAELPLILRTFHAAFPVDSVYRSHLASHGAVIDGYRALIRQKASMVFAYARVRDTSELSGFGEYGRVKVVPCLLLSHLHDFGFDADSVHYRVLAPAQKLAYDPHDFVHAVTRAISHDTARHGNVQRAALRAHEAAYPNATLNRPIATYVDESLVAAINLRLATLSSPSDSTLVRQNWTHGDKVLAPYFVEQLKVYERQRAPLRDYYPRLFDRLGAWLDSAGIAHPR